LQQPPGHELALQTHWPFALHACPAAHPPHFAPDSPQEIADSDPYASHVPVAPPLQQPFGHVVASQAHAPLLVSHTPFEHAPHVAPPAPHCDGVSDEYATHAPLLQHPAGHEFASHAQADALLVHSCPVAHEPHAAPPAPHDVPACAEYETHVLPSQQPFGHELALQTHCPLALHA
jgi:hypothetical protein